MLPANVIFVSNEGAQTENIKNQRKVLPCYVTLWGVAKVRGRIRRRWRAGLCYLNKQTQWKHEVISSASCRSHDVILSLRRRRRRRRRRSQNHHHVNWFLFSPSLRAVLRYPGATSKSLGVVMLRHSHVCFLRRPLSIATSTAAAWLLVLPVTICHRSPCRGRLLIADPRYVNPFPRPP